MSYSRLMRLLGLIYIGGAVGFFFFPNETFYLINVGPKVFRITQAIPDSVEHFWGVLATSMMVMLAALSFLAAESPQIRGYALVHILSKITSSAGFLYMFVWDKPYFAYLIGIATDLPLALIVMWIMARAKAQPNKVGRAKLA